MYGAFVGDFGGYISGGLGGILPGAITGGVVGLVAPTTSYAVEIVATAAESIVGQAAGLEFSGKKSTDFSNYSSGTIIGSVVGYRLIGPVASIIGSKMS